jgi:hypothetical protein
MHASHVVVDTRDGYTFWKDADGELFTLDTAHRFAMVRNHELIDPTQYHVFALVEVV